MIRSAGIIFEDYRSGTPPADITLRKDLDGDSGVGQAPEFPSKSLLANSQLKTRATRKKSLHFWYTSRLLSRVGTILIIFSLLGFLLTYGPIIKVELGYRLSSAEDETTAPKGNFSELLGQTLIGEQEGVPDPNFSLIIPKIHAKARVVPNVDPANETEYYAALQSGVAHARGTYFPGGEGNVYMFAHSTDSPLNILRYNAIFYLLREVEVGDDVQVYFGGVKHSYSVTDKKIVEPTDISYLTPTNSERKERLILQTCWPPGTTLKRLLVFAEKREI